MLFTALTIDQVNGSANRMKRGDQISTIGKIVNDKLKRDDISVSDVAFFRNIEKNLDLSCTLEHADKREILR